MTFGVVLSITNPISSGYLAYIASIVAWVKIADEVIIVDGGSSDNSLEVIKALGVDYKRIKVISNDITFWGNNDNFHALQLNVNLNYGLEKLSTDWAFAFSTDYIPYFWDKNKLLDELSKYGNNYWIRTYVGKPQLNRIVHRYNNRNIIFNLKKIKQDNIKICYGMSISKIPGDFPIIVTENSTFTDYTNCTEKYIYRGIPNESKAIVDFECIAYGHFFYTHEQLEYKIQRWDRAFSRFLGIAPARLKQLLIWHNVPRGKKYYSKEEVLKWDHPEEIKEVIEQYYKEGMIGGIIDERKLLNKKIDKMILILLKIERKMRTFYLKKFKGLKAEKDQLKWEKFV